MRSNYIIYIIVVCTFGVIAETMMLYFPYEMNVENGTDWKKTIEAWKKYKIDISLKL